MFDVCTTGDTAQIDAIFKFLPHTRQHGCSNGECWRVYCLVGKRNSFNYMDCIYGLFIPFSWLQIFITRKPKGLLYWNCLQPQERWKGFFLTTRDVRCVRHGWHGTHRYDIQVLATHGSTWVHQYSSLLQCFVPKAWIFAAVKNTDTCVARTWMSYRSMPCHPWCTHRTSLVVKKTFFSVPVAVNVSIKVDPLVFLL
jgi:hypothetical protein